MEWELFIYYKSKERKLKAVLEYQSSQIMRIRVFGSTTSILLENNYPIIKTTNSKKGLQWKIREGSFGETDKDTARLLIDIFSQLEYLIKKDIG